MTPATHSQGATMKTLIRSTMLAVLALAASCTTPELIDRTQPNYVKKDDLLSGQWYWKQSVIDVPRTSPVATTARRSFAGRATPEPTPAPAISRRARSTLQNNRSTYSTWPLPLAVFLKSHQLM